MFSTVKLLWGPVVFMLSLVYWAYGIPFLAAIKIRYRNRINFLSVFLNVAGNSLSPLWRRIVVYPPDRESLQNIVGARYQNLILIGRFLLRILPLIWFLYSQWNFTFPSLQKLMKKSTLLFVPSFLVRQLKTQLHSVPRVVFHWGKLSIYPRVLLFIIDWSTIVSEWSSFPEICSSCVNEFRVCPRMMVMQFLWRSDSMKFTYASLLF